MNKQARGGGNSNCRWQGILIVANQPFLVAAMPRWEESELPLGMPFRSNIAQSHMPHIGNSGRLAGW